SSVPLLNYFISAGYVLSNYIFKLLIPFQLSPHYPYPFNLYEPAPYSFYLYLFIFPFITLLILKIRKNKLLLFGILFYLINVVLMIRFVPVAENVMPDRYNYIASIGFLIIFVVVLEKYLKTKLLTAVYVISSLFFIKTITQTKVWKDGIQVWTTAFKYYPNDSEINQNLGSHYMRKGNISKATIYLEKA